MPSVEPWVSRLQLALRLPAQYFHRGIQGADDAAGWARDYGRLTYLAYPMLVYGGIKLAKVWAPTADSHLMARQCKICAFLAIALALLLGPMLVGHTLDNRSRRPRLRRETLAVLAAALFVGWFIMEAGSRQIGGFDHSILINTGWLQMLGLRPYEDFPCTVPPFFFLGVKYAFQWGGVRWISLVAICAFGSVAALGWSYVLLRSLRLSGAMSLLLAAEFQAVTMMLTSYWWYNPPLSMAAILFFLSALVWSERPNSRAAFFSLLAAGVVLFLNKPNGWPLIGMCGTILLCSRAHRWRVLLALLLGTAAVAIIARLAGFSLGGMLESYAGIFASRNPAATPMVFHGPREDRILGFSLLGLLLGSALASGALFALQRRAWLGRVSRETLLCAAAALSGIILYLSNGECKLIDLAPTVAGVLLGVFRAAPAFQAAIPHALHFVLRIAMVALMFFLLGAGLVLGWQRYRVRAIGPNVFFQSMLCDQSPAIPFFAHVQTGPRLVQVVDQLRQTLAEHPQAKVYFGPRMEWAYAAFDQPVPRGFPIWWDPGTAYPKALEPALADRWVAAQFDLLIFLKNTRQQPDMTFLPERLRHDVLSQYGIRETLEDLVVYRHKQIPARIKQVPVPDGVDTAIPASRHPPG
jgi:hypothetical protein